MTPIMKEIMPRNATIVAMSLTVTAIAPNRKFNWFPGPCKPKIKPFSLTKRDCEKQNNKNKKRVKLIQILSVFPEKIKIK